MKKQNYKYAVCRPLDLNEVNFTGGFWKPIVNRSRRKGLPRLLTQYENRNIVKNFHDAAAGRPRAEEDNAINYDEFLFKALEACNYYLGEENSNALNEQYCRIRDAVLSAQQADGYINTYAIQTDKPRFGGGAPQELYAGGHLMQAGIAESRLTGNRTLFKAAKKYIDCLIDGYGPDGSKLPENKWPDHPNVEMALVELYRETGDRKYLDFSRLVLDCGNYLQRTQMLNHAVCELLCATGGIDYYLETGDPEIWTATKRLWNDMLKKVYVSGAVGSVSERSTPEAAGKAFALNNDRAYAETCAAISLVFWSWRMFLATGQGDYVDMLERALYNGVLGGISMDSCEYFYENPLEYRNVTAQGSAASDDQHADFCESAQRKARHNCSCCPPNVHRLFASLQQYIYSTDGRNVWVNLFADCRSTLSLENGARINLRQKTDYPRDGRIEIEVKPMDGPTEFTLKTRVPAWCENPVFAINEEKLNPDVSKGYAEIGRKWSHSDILTIDLPMSPYLVSSHPKNIANYEKLVLARGPVIYCLEGVDNPEIDIFSVVLPENIQFRESHSDGMLDEFVLLEGNALVRNDSDWDQAPYKPYVSDRKKKLTPAKVTAIPYYARCNREKCSMITAMPFVKG